MVIDFHTHILPGIDDGSSDLQMSMAMLNEERHQGVDVVVLTPHFYGSQESIDHFIHKRNKAYALLKAQKKDQMPYTLCGAEVAFFPGISHADGIEQLCLAGTNTMLLEMPFAQWKENELREVIYLMDRGIHPLLAHIERFLSFQKDKSVLEAILDLPLLTQINAECLLSGSLRRKRKVIGMLRDGYINLMGSDCHNMTSRPPNYGEGRQMLEKYLDHYQLKHMENIGCAVLGI